MLARSMGYVYQPSTLDGVRDVIREAERSGRSLVPRGSGFSYGDTNVGLIVSNPTLKATTLKTPVTTSQVAPTILGALGLNPKNLKSVQVEKTEKLSGLPF